MTDEQNAAVRAAMLNDYERKDAALRCFEKTGRFFPEKEGDDKGNPWVDLVCVVGHWRMNVTLAAHTALSLVVLHCAFGIAPRAALLAGGRLWAALTLFYGGTHAAAAHVSGGVSRESIPFETVLKSLLELCQGGLNHGSTKPAAARPPRSRSN